MKFPKANYWRAASGQWYFNIQSRNGKIIAQSEGYQSRRGCLKGIAALRRAAPIAKREFHDSEQA